MAEIKHFIIYSIGELKKENNKTCIHLKDQFIRGLKQMEFFSHLRVFWLNREEKTLEQRDPFPQNPIALNTVAIEKVEKGIIEIVDTAIPSGVEILDIKAYIPIEDTLKSCSTPKQRPITKRGKNNFEKATELPLKISPIGKILHKGGKTYIEILPDYINNLTSLNDFSHINLIWYFNRFDNPSLRKMLVCNPPYEAPKTGVFASRAPVRPNPLALTVCPVINIDKTEGLIEIGNIDAYAGTPVIGIKPYIPEMDRIEDVKVPKWLSHWPRCIQEEEENSNLVQITEADIHNLVYYSERDETDEKKELANKKEKKLNVSKNFIHLYGARQHNLKNIDVSIPIGKMTVITGVSGSGKSSLAFDTIYAEGQRRYMQSLSTASRMAAGQLEKPDFDNIHNLLPAIAIEQKAITRNPRSTVGSISDVYSYLRLIYSRLGTRFCTKCGKEIAPLTIENLSRKIMNLLPCTTVGFFPGKKTDTEDLESRITIPDDAHNIRQIISRCYSEGSGFLTLIINDETKIRVTENSACTTCDSIYFKMSPSIFSYNSPVGMCQICKGMGLKMEVDPGKIISSPELSILDKASPWYGDLRKHRKKPSANWFRNEILALADSMGIDLELPWNELPEEFREKALYGTGKEEYQFTYDSEKTGRSGTITRPVGGAVNHIAKLFSNSKAGNSHEVYKQFLSENPCPDCLGERLSPQGRFVQLAGKRYPEVASMTIQNAMKWLKGLPESFSETSIHIAENLMEELGIQLQSMEKTGLYYLTLDRPVTTLSGGESQRIKLASQLGCGLSGLLYVLDEPSIGLHPKDHQKMINTMKQLRDGGNTILIVEHDEDTMLAADHIIDIGPGAGINGGEIIAQGTPDEIMINPGSITGPFLNDTKKTYINPNKKVDQNLEYLTIKGAELHNLKNIDASFPLGRVSTVTGVSGSGKSSLIRGTLVPAVIQKLNGIETESGKYEQITGLEHLDKIINIDQSSIGRSPRSIPATYIGCFDEIRKIFAKTHEAKKMKYGNSKFSFNDKAGRCPTCEGLGKIKIDMSFLPDTWISCSDCDGKRYNRDILDICYKNKNIDDVLSMDVNEALCFFADEKKVLPYLRTMHDVGLDYLKLGQSSATLSGGEAQRIKLAKELCRQDTGKTLYVLDEPTSGLHMADIGKLLKVIHRLADLGNTVIIIEHNIHVIEESHWIVDLGPSGGEEGGYLIGEGTPEQIRKNKKSHTGRFLQKLY